MQERWLVWERPRGSKCFTLAMAGNCNGAQHHPAVFVSHPLALEWSAKQTRTRPDWDFRLTRVEIREWGGE